MQLRLSFLPDADDALDHGATQDKRRPSAKKREQRAQSLDGSCLVPGLQPRGSGALLTFSLCFQVNEGGDPYGDLSEALFRSLMKCYLVA
jgi:hypothetical protein